jgi:hypothetical protein
MAMRCTSLLREGPGDHENGAPTVPSLFASPPHRRAFVPVLRPRHGWRVSFGVEAEVSDGAPSACGPARAWSERGYRFGLFDLRHRLRRAALRRMRQYHRGRRSGCRHRCEWLHRRPGARRRAARLSSLATSRRPAPLGFPPLPEGLAIALRVTRREGTRAGLCAFFRSGPRQMSAHSRERGGIQRDRRAPRRADLACHLYLRSFGSTSLTSWSIGLTSSHCHGLPAVPLKNSCLLKRMKDRSGR